MRGGLAKGRRSSPDGRRDHLSREWHCALKRKRGGGERGNKRKEGGGQRERRA